MAIVNFSVPSEVKKAFDRAFKNQNKSAVIAELMRQAVADTKLRERRSAIFAELMARRTLRPRRTDRELRAARVAGRP